MPSPSNTYIYQMTDTWDQPNTVYNAWSMTVTSTNSHANSNLFKFVYNSNTYLRLRKDGSLIYNPPVVPANSTANGVTGQITWDSNYVYVCIANNTWKRTALTTW